MAGALAGRDPQAWDVVKRSFAGKAKEFLVRK